MNKDCNVPARDGGSCGEAEKLLEFDGQDGHVLRAIVQNNTAATGDDEGGRGVFIETVALFPGKEGLQGRQQREPGKLLFRTDACKPGGKPCFRGRQEGFLGHVRPTLSRKSPAQQGDSALKLAGLSPEGQVRGP